MSVLDVALVLSIEDEVWFSIDDSDDESKRIVNRTREGFLPEMVLVMINDVNEMLRSEEIADVEDV